MFQPDVWNVEEQRIVNEQCVTSLGYEMQVPLASWHVVNLIPFITQTCAESYADHYARGEYPKVVYSCYK